MRQALLIATIVLIACQLVLSFYYSTEIFQENNLYSLHQKKLTNLEIEYSSLFTQLTQIHSSSQITPLPSAVPINKSLILP